MDDSRKFTSTLQTGYLRLTYILLIHIFPSSLSSMILFSYCDYTKQVQILAQVLPLLYGYCVLVRCQEFSHSNLVYFCVGNMNFYRIRGYFTQTIYQL